MRCRLVLALLVGGLVGLGAGPAAKAGPILYLAKAFDISVEEAVKWVILLIIFVFDPLAVFLLIAGNFLLERRQQRGFDVRALTPSVPEWNPEKVQNPIMQGPIYPTFNSSNVPPMTAEDEARLTEVLKSYEQEVPEVTSEPQSVQEQTTTLLPHGSASEVQDHEPLPSTHELPPVPVEDTVDAPLSQVREEITEDNLRRPAASSLERVEPDANTTVSWPGEVGYGTGAFVTQSKKR